jgi:hypothetical protein
MMQQVIEAQGGWQYLDSEPRTLAAREHSPAYTTDGDYFSKPSAEDIFDKVYGMMHEAMPAKYKNSEKVSGFNAEKKEPGLRLPGSCFILYVATLSSV